MTPPEPTAPPPPVALLGRRYLLPRAVLAAGLWAFLAFGLDPRLRGGIEEAAGRLAGRRADVDAVRTGLFPPRLEVRGFALPDRDRPGRDLVRFARLRVDLDPAALADRRLEATGGSLTGLTFGAARESDAAAPDPLRFPLLDPAELLPRCPGLTDARGALGDLPALLADRGPAAAEALETVRLAHRLRGEWAARFAGLSDRGDGLRRRMKGLSEKRTAAADPRSDPIARLAAVRALAMETAAVLAEADALADEWPTFAEQAAADRAALAAARRRDAAKLRALAAAAQGDPDAAARALLGPAFSRRVTVVLAVTEWLRDRLGEGGAIDELWPARRGVRVPFPVGAARPAVLLNDLAVTGSLPTADGPVAFAGTLTGLTSHPALFAGPLAGSFTAAAGALSPESGVDAGDNDSRKESPRFSVAFTHAAGGGEPVTDVDLRVVAAVPAGARVWVGGAPVGVSGAGDEEPARVEWAARVRLTGRGEAAAVLGTVGPAARRAVGRRGTGRRRRRGRCEGGAGGERGGGGAGSGRRDAAPVGHGGAAGLAVGDRRRRPPAGEPEDDRGGRRGPVRRAAAGGGGRGRGGVVGGPVGPVGGGAGHGGRRPARRPFRQRAAAGGVAGGGRFDAADGGPAGRRGAVRWRRPPERRRSGRRCATQAGRGPRRGRSVRWWRSRSSGPPSPRCGG